MLCEECNVRPAEVTITTVIGGESTTRHLCRECMKKYQNGDMSAILAAILSSMTQKNNDPDITCPHCGQTVAQFRKSGMLGCAECYHVFREELKPLFTRIQGRTQHAGRRPPASPEEQERIRKMEALRTALEEAVATEEYEKAAQYRDELKALQMEAQAAKETENTESGDEQHDGE